MSPTPHPPAAGNANLRLARCQVFETACFHTLAHSAAPRPTPNAFPFNHFHTLFVATGYAPTLPILELNPPPSIQLSFQQLTQYPFCKSFCLIYIHLMGGCTPLLALPLIAKPAQRPRSRLPPPPTAQSGPATAPRERCSSSGQGFLPPPPAARS